MKYPYPLVEIVWDDACSEGGWHEVKDIKLSPEIVTTVGFLIAENTKYLMLGHTFSGNDFNGKFQIPKKVIISRKVLKGVK